jgi:hypothetical protein
MVPDILPEAKTDQMYRDAKEFRFSHPEIIKVCVHNSSIILILVCRPKQDLVPQENKEEVLFLDFASLSNAE